MTRFWEIVQIKQHSELVPWVKGEARMRFEGERQAWKEIKELIENWSEEAKEVYP